MKGVKIFLKKNSKSNNMAGNSIKDLSDDERQRTSRVKKKYYEMQKIRIHHN